MTPMPIKAMPAPMTWNLLGRSPSSTKAMAMVKKAWVCSTRDDSPAGMPQAIERLRKA